jgi:predicted Zn-ribbon and HTH transcriptional regulator
MEKTVRQQMVELLKVKPVDTGYLSRALGISQRAVEAHLEHIAKAKGKTFVISPPECRDCEYKFKERTRTTKPSRCPKCKSELLMPPLFFIEGE